MEFAEDVVLGSMAGAMKARDPRFALHSPTVDPVEGEGSGRPEDGRGDCIHVWTLDLTEVVLTRVQEDRLVIESWHPGRGYQRRERS